jgi:hypothetical protein
MCCLRNSGIMEAMRKSWTDERLDDFRGDVDRRFEEVGRRFDGLEVRMERGFGKCEVEFQRINDRIDGLSKAIVYGALTLSGSTIAGFIAIAFALP